MWSLPALPTDNLYKLITLLGMAMWVSAFYLMYAEQRPFEESGTFIYSRAAILRDRLEDAGVKPKPLEKDITEESPYDRYREFRDLIHSAALDPVQAQQLRDMNEQLLNTRLSNLRNVDRAEQMAFNIRFLTILAGILTTCGGVAWYFCFQRHQDFIAKVNALEAFQRVLLAQATALHNGLDKEPPPAKKTRKRVTQAPT
ncbi:hypothetical protein [Rhizobium leguminosarum]|uniref:hypothetical protein n=1 Tax=Rhizobium leguminosarum TaxID=384 RepID=UPI0016075D9C|nr:hypothetical protein [Rhizobium leguminosarum]MBB4345199.1 hypothetical protein [Rhizobium leguminosarum]MBB6298270.1 hypothetical protein [Rhizobium leguminosarum]WHO79771.1 hypothetical protein QMO81_002466 [Rhizobium leguminosarum]